MAKIGTIGAKLDMLVKSGSDFGKYTLTVRNADKTPINLTNYTFVGRIKKTYSSPTLVAEFTFTSVDLVNGQIAISLPNTVTALLKGSADPSESIYIYDIEMIDGNLFVEPLFYGEISVFANA